MKFKEDYKGPVIALSFSVLLLGALFAFTRPDTLPAAMLIIVFGLAYILVASVAALILLMWRGFSGGTRGYARLKRTAYAIAVVPTFLLVLQSIGQLTVQDVFLTLALGNILYFYYRRFFSRPESPIS